MLPRDGSHSAASAPYERGSPMRPPHIDQCLSECIDQCVIVTGRRRDAQPFGSTRDGRIVDRLDVDAVLGKQEIARFCTSPDCLPSPARCAYC